MASTALAPAPPGLGILTVTLVRHAQSEDNANGILAGHRDAPLSALGRAQARALGKGLQWQQLQAVYSSDLKRARETAGEIVEVRVRMLRSPDAGLASEDVALTPCTGQSNCACADACAHAGIARAVLWRR